MARIVNCLFLEIAICCSSHIDFLARTMAVWFSVGQSEISSRSKLIADCIICLKWRFDYYIEATFKLVRDLNPLHGMTQ